MAAMKSGVQSKKENEIIRWVYESVFYQIDFAKLRLKMMEYEKEKVYFLGMTKVQFAIMTPVCGVYERFVNKL